MKITPPHHKINKEWHLAHKMPFNPTIDQRIAWHIAHAEHCNCRSMPQSIQKIIEPKRKDAIK